MTVTVSVMGLILCAITAEAKTNVTSQPFGKLPDGTPIEIYTLNDGRVEARIMTYGGTVVSLRVPDRKGQAADVVLGFDNLDGYVANNNNKGTAFFGALIGRYANRIAHASFALNGKKYEVPKNDGDNSLHGGTHGFNNVVWKGKTIANGVELTYLSKDGEAGYPGNLTTVVRYTLVNGNLRIDYSATTDNDTVLNLTNHSYFNLAGQGNGDVLGHQLTLHASRFTPVDATLIPTGELKSVELTPFDFRKPTAIGSRINADDEQLHRGRGYDHNWVLNTSPARSPAPAARLHDPKTGRVMELSTTEPGVQFYAGNGLDGTLLGSSRKTYRQSDGLCLETQHFPDSPNKPAFPSTVLRPGDTYRTTTVHRFLTDRM